MWTDIENTKLRNWVSLNYPEKESMIDKWIRESNATPCEPNQGTGADLHLVNSIKNSIQNRLIETGTEAGSFIMNFIEDASEILTCEVDEGSYLCAKYRHQNYSNISSKLMDSKSFLESIELRSDDVFFLDAHGGGYDPFTENPLTHELNIIRDSGIKPTIFIHDFGIETDKNPNEGRYWHHESLEKVYEYRFDFDTENGWKLDWDFIKYNIESIYGEEYVLEYPPFQDNQVVVGWIKISPKLV